MAASGLLLSGPCPTMTGSPRGTGPGERGEVGERGEAGERGEVGLRRASSRSLTSQDGIWGGRRNSEMKHHQNPPSL